MIPHKALVQAPTASDLGYSYKENDHVECH